jgi:hypothetical protein
MEFLKRFMCYLSNFGWNIKGAGVNMTCIIKVHKMPNILMFQVHY